MVITQKENVRKSMFLFGMLLICYLMMLMSRSYTQTPVVPADSGSRAEAFDESKIELFSQTALFEETPLQAPIEGVQLVKGVDSGYGATGGAGKNGCQATNPQGCESEKFPFQPVCSTTPVNIGLNDGAEKGNNGQTVTVAKNAVLEIWKVTSPMGLLSGIEDMSDNTFAISKKEVRFRSSSDLIKDEYIGQQSVAPKSSELVSISETIPDYEYPVGEPYSVNIKISNSPKEPDQATVERELLSKLPVEVQRSDPNPGVTNQIADIVTSLRTPPTTNVQPRNYGTADCIDVSNIEFMPNQNVFETCVNRRSPMDFVFTALVDAKQWVECLANRQQCAEVEIVGLLIDAIYGSNQTCNDEYCADQFFDHSLATNLSPLDFPDYVEPGFENNPEPIMKAHYVTTPCQVRVDYKNIYDIPCLWDVSPYMTLYNTEAQMRAPGDPDMPSWDEYWKAVVEEAERRGEACGVF